MSNESIVRRISDVVNSFDGDFSLSFVENNVNFQVSRVSPASSGLGGHCPCWLAAGNSSASRKYSRRARWSGESYARLGGVGGRGVVQVFSSGGRGKGVERGGTACAETVVEGIASVRERSSAVASEHVVHCDEYKGGVSSKTDHELGSSERCVQDAASKCARGPNWEKNNKRRMKEKAKKMKATAVGASSDDLSSSHVSLREDSKVPEWRRTAKGNSGCPSLSGSVRTVDTRTAVEIEAAETLAARRVVENKLAIVKGNKLLKSFDNKSKTEAIETLEIARMESRINEAKLRSQVAYGKCDRSLKSVSSALSAGEFAMKKTAAENAELRLLVDNLKQQVKVVMKHATGKAMSELATIPDVRKVGIRDVMGDPTDKWTMRETNAYYSILNAEAQGDYETPWEDFFR